MKKTVSVILSLMFILMLAVPAFAAEEQLTFMAIGDSIAKGSGLINQPQACYTRIICDTNGYKYVNEGVDGNTSADVLARMQTEKVREEIAEADIIDISVGGNDFLMANIAELIFKGFIMHDSSVFEKITKNYYANLCEIIGIIKEINPYATVIMQTLYNPAPTWLSKHTEEPVNMLNDCIFRYLRENPGAYEIVDIYSAFQGHPEYTELIHPNVKGNELIAEEILKLLESLGYDVATEIVITKKGINSWEFYAAILIGFVC